MLGVSWCSRLLLQQEIRLPVACCTAGKAELLSLIDYFLHSVWGIPCVFVSPVVSRVNSFVELMSFLFYKIWLLSYHLLHSTAHSPHCWVSTSNCDQTLIAIYTTLSMMSLWCHMCIAIFVVHTFGNEPVVFSIACGNIILISAEMVSELSKWSSNRLCFVYMQCSAQCCFMHSDNRGHFILNSVSTPTL